MDVNKAKTFKGAGMLLGIGMMTSGVLMAVSGMGRDLQLASNTAPIDDCPANVNIQRLLYQFSEEVSALKQEIATLRVKKTLDAKK